ncbi:hypothetical protein SAMN05660772_02817 [Pasteurella testudinis DSM 23072]|uniref:ASCH domain-containing protein n=1 Tax=Pasteurella testudinis DSM 23072 TaxID=1122938 RepID=A0A1W1V655_9PAST|nr:hypothetical protein [Pasteurella testudinis]SMB88494.1 hypothetical protein SAMN05660772_02817 [Pasteurella testudinis DSM 23072]SUB51624.1 Uncharacterised protein [Pasteurella testudinis]
MKALFIPLKRCWFEQFKNGHKNFEYRGYGRQWTEKHCVVGRSVTLALGYGKTRLHGKIESFQIIPIELSPTEAQEIYQGRYQYIAKIGVTLCI